MSTHDSEKRKHTLDDLVTQLERVLTAADKADHDLAAAISVADGATTPEAAKKQAVSWTPTAADVVLGGTAGATAAKTDILRDIWLKGMGKDVSPVDRGVAPWLKDIGKLKGVSRAGGIVGIVTAIPSVFADVGDGDSWGVAVMREGTGAAAGVAAGAGATAAASAAGSVIASTEIGAAIGSAVPGVGTVVGAGVGAVVGGLAAYGTSKSLSALLDHGN